MKNYYAVERSSDSLQHYGVKGMKWGVRRAIERGSERALGRQYRKAQRKLQRLQDNADVDKQRKLNQQWKANALGYGVSAGLYPVAGQAMTQLSKQGALNSIARQAKALEKVPGYHMVSSTYRDYRPWGAIAGAASLGGAIGSGINAHRAKKRTTKEGHAQAVRELNTWKSEMNKAFKGTKYAGKQRPSIVNKPNTSGLSKKDQKMVNQQMNRWADTFEKQYQKGLSKGMTHEQAERYSNDYIAKNGFGSSKSKKKR